MKRSIIGIIAGFFILFVVAVWFGFHKGFLATTNVSVTFTTPTPTPDPLASKNILLLGYGGGNHDGAFLTDSMMIAHIDPKTRVVILLSIPRDLWVPLPLLPGGAVQEKINAAYAYGFETQKYLNRPSQYSGNTGGANLSKYAATLVTGLPIDAYVSVSFDGFKSAVTILGPVSVNVPYSFEDPYYPIDGKEQEACGKTPEEVKQTAATESGDILEHEYMCRFETVKFEKGIRTMDADAALKFVRSRHSSTNPGDFFRSMRQQALIQAVIAKLKTIGGLVKIPALIPEVSKVITTDLTAPQLLDMMKRYGDPLNFHIGRISLTEDNVLVASASSDGQYILVPKDGNGFDRVKQYVFDQLIQLTASTSAIPITR